MEPSFLWILACLLLLLAFIDLNIFFAAAHCFVKIYEANLVVGSANTPAGLVCVCVCVCVCRHGSGINE